MQSFLCFPFFFSHSFSFSSYMYITLPFLTLSSICLSREVEASASRKKCTKKGIGRYCIRLLMLSSFLLRQVILFVDIKHSESLNKGLFYEITNFLRSGIQFCKAILTKTQEIPFIHLILFKLSLSHPYIIIYTETRIRDSNLF